MVSVLAFYSDDPSSIPAEVYNFFCKIVVEKNENKQKEAGVGPFFKKKIILESAVAFIQAYVFRMLHLIKLLIKN